MSEAADAFSKLWAMKVEEVADLAAGDIEGYDPKDRDALLQAADKALTEALYAPSIEGDAYEGLERD